MEVLNFFKYYVIKLINFIGLSPSTYNYYLLSLLIIMILIAIILFFVVWIFVVGNNKEKEFYE